MITIRNDILTVKIAKRGAEIKSIVKDNTEYIYPSQPAIWNKSAPLLFPICGSVKENTYTHKGKTYHMDKHGFAQFMTYEVESRSETSAVFLLRESEETLAQYPFAFALRVIYELEGCALKVTYSVENHSDEEMFFSIGAHEGYYTPEGIEDYDIHFETPVTLDHTPLLGPLVTNERIRMLTDGYVFPLYEKFFVTDALVFENVATKALTLRNRKNGKAIKVDFPFAKNLLLWHKPSAPYLCIEPWAGIPDRIGTTYELGEKEDILSLAPSGEYRGEHTITIL
ncbi:MAG: aldose 1-epimerase family protein [Clostridia bacterium]|nr:aldose 1-epimerase family protein [Clostridia bacterium]